MSFAETDWLADEYLSLASLASVKVVVFEFMARGVDGKEGKGIDEVVNGYSTSYWRRLSAALSIGWGIRTASAPCDTTGVLTDCSGDS